MSSKIAVTGSVNGKIEELFSKLTKVHAKADLSFALIAGDLFAAPDAANDDDQKAVEALLNGSLSVPLPTYFTVGQHALPDEVIERIEAKDNEVCTNLYFLGKRSTTNTSEGIRIVALGGNLDAQIAAGESKDKYLPFHTENDARTLRGANHADILLTTHWPSGVQNGSKVNTPAIKGHLRAEQCVADLCAALRPKYLFSTSDEVFYEREPFQHPSTESAPDAHFVTRFISLAAITSTSKAKWLYAFSLDPKGPAIISPPAGTTASPFAPSRKRSLAPNHTTQPPATTGMRNPKRRKKPQPPPGPGECFFCLANPNLDTHLLTSIGEQSYLSTARGPLIERTTYPELPFQAHILIIPLAHAATLSAIAAADAVATFTEMQRYRHALQRMLTATTRGALGAVTWELSRSQGVHAHWQFIPVPRGLVADGLAEAAFRVQAENAAYPAFDSRDTEHGTAEGDYFRVWLWKPPAEDEIVPEKGDGSDATAPGGTETQLFASLAGVARFDVAFGRRVIAQLLDREDRVDWKACRQSDAEETADAEAFKAAFKAWDFAQ